MHGLHTCKYKTPDNLMQQEVPAVALYAAINLGSGTAGCAAGPFKVTKSTHKLMQFIGGIVQEAASSGNSTVVQSMCDAVLDIAVFFTSPSSKMKEQLAQVASCPFPCTVTAKHHFVSCMHIVVCCFAGELTHILQMRLEPTICCKAKSLKCCRCNVPA